MDEFRTHRADTAIDDELPETDHSSLGEVQGHCSDDDGIPDVGTTIGLGGGSMLWIGEILRADGGDIGIVFHGPGGKRVAAALWPECEWQDAAEILRDHVAPLLRAARAAPAVATYPQPASEDGATLRGLLKRAQANIAASEPIANRMGVTRRLLADINAALSTTADRGEDRHHDDCGCMLCQADARVDAGASTDMAGGDHLAAPPMEGLTSGEGDIEQAAISLIVDLCGAGASQSATNLRVVEDHLRQFARSIASPKATATASVRDVFALSDHVRGIATVIRAFPNDKAWGGVDQAAEAAQILDRAATALALTDSGTAATIGGERA